MHSTVVVLRPGVDQFYQPFQIIILTSGSYCTSDVATRRVFVVVVVSTSMSKHSLQEPLSGFLYQQ